MRVGFLFILLVFFVVSCDVEKSPDGKTTITFDTDTFKNFFDVEENKNNTADTTEKKEVGKTNVAEKPEEAQAKNEKTDGESLKKENPLAILVVIFASIVGVLLLVMFFMAFLEVLLMMLVMFMEILFIPMFMFVCMLELIIILPVMLVMMLVWGVVYPAAFIACLPFSVPFLIALCLANLFGEKISKGSKGKLDGWLYQLKQRKKNP